MVKVRKRDGNCEDLDTKKLRRSIEKAALDAGLILDEKRSKIGKLVKTIVDKAMQDGSIETKVIRRIILEDLDRFEPEISRSWRDFDKKYKA